jgi:ABC-2 type transport system ATP-binding protein
VTAALEATGLGKRYGSRWALSDCTLAIPTGRVVGLVGPNGAGKTTLLSLAVGLLSPTSGSIAVLGAQPAAAAPQMGRIGFVSQDTPLYSRLSVADHLRLGAHMNPGWDNDLAQSRLDKLDIDLVGTGTTGPSGRVQPALHHVPPYRPTERGR